MIVVGRGITLSQNPKVEIQKYKVERKSQKIAKF